ncbi:MAG: AAA family ATPase, partial [Pseudomonadota bacterium]|nr:AAA family ATPase [Pseudomonadota bacterium]
MILRALRLADVRRFAGTGVAIEGIGDGVNVLCAPNEAGKSTCLDALQALVVQAHTGPAAAVRSLRPHAGGNPLVEAEFEFPDGRFRVLKRWLGAKRALVHDAGSGRLVAQGDEAEAWLAARLPGGARGPAGLLWVAQGGAEMGAADRGAREDALAAVAGEVEALTGGRRMVRALARCNEELGALVTATGRPKAGGDYARALEAAERHGTAAEALSARVAALRETLA